MSPFRPPDDVSHRFCLDVEAIGVDPFGAAADLVVGERLREKTGRTYAIAINCQSVSFVATNLSPGTPTLRPQARIFCELRNHGEVYGFEVQFPELRPSMAKGPVFSRGAWPSRELAISWAEQERKVMEKVK